MNRSEILKAAGDLITGDRQKAHGDAREGFARLAAVWSAMTGATITAPQVAIMLGQLKDVRAWSNPGHADNWTDKAGYAALGGEIADAGGEGKT